MFHHIETLAERLTWIVENRKETATGRPMSGSALSKAAGLNRTHVANLINDERGRDMTTQTAIAIAWAGQVSLNWLQTGRGSPNDKDVPPAPPVREKRPEPGTYGEYPEWKTMLERAKQLPRPIEPEEACLAGADLKVPIGHRPSRLTPTIVRAICEFDWHTSSDNKKGAFVDKFIRIEKQRAVDSGSFTMSRRPKRLLRESGFPPLLVKK